MHSSQQKSVQRSTDHGTTAALEHASGGRAVQLKGLDFVQQEAALDPNAQPDFDEQDAGVSAHGGKDGCATIPKSAPTKVKSVSIESAYTEFGTVYVKGTLTKADGEEVAFNVRTQSDAKSAAMLAIEVAALNKLDKAGQEQVRAAIAANLPE